MKKTFILTATATILFSTAAMAQTIYVGVANATKDTLSIQFPAPQTTPMTLVPNNAVVVWEQPLVTPGQNPTINSFVLTDGNQTLTCSVLQGIENQQDIIGIEPPFSASTIYIADQGRGLLNISCK